MLLVLAIRREIRRAPPSRRLPVALGLAGVVALVGGVLYAWFAPGLLSSAGGIHALALRGAGGFGSASAAGPPQWARMAGFAAAVALAAPFATGGPLALPLVPGGPIALAVVRPPGGAGRWLRFTSLGLAAGLMLYYVNLVPPG